MGETEFNAAVNDAKSNPSNPMFESFKSSNMPAIAGFLDRLGQEHFKGQTRTIGDSSPLIVSGDGRFDTEEMARVGIAKAEADGDIISDDEIATKRATIEKAISPEGREAAQRAIDALDARIGILGVETLMENVLSTDGIDDVILTRILAHYPNASDTTPPVPGAAGEGSLAAREGASLLEQQLGIPSTWKLYNAARSAGLTDQNIVKILERLGEAGT